jgi:hypothetical protein
MKNKNDFSIPPEFGGKTAEEQLDDFMDECPVTDDAYVNFYGAYYSVMRKILPTSKDVLIWMVFNCEPDKGRVFIQSLTRNRLLKELGISQVTYFKCLRDLRKHDVIRGLNAIYYINPRFVWRGTNKRRLIFMSQYPHIQCDRLPRK